MKSFFKFGIMLSALMILAPTMSSASVTYTFNGYGYIGDTQVRGERDDTTIIPVSFVETLPTYAVNDMSFYDNGWFITMENHPLSLNCTPVPWYGCSNPLWLPSAPWVTYPDSSGVIFQFVSFGFPFGAFRHDGTYGAGYGGWEITMGTVGSENLTVSTNNS